jgi:uncharacterized membrane protein
MMNYLRKYFISGLLIWLPIWVTILVVEFVVNILSSTFSLLPYGLRPTTSWVGIIITLLIILLTGVIAANFIGSKMVELWNAFVSRIPLIRSVYSSTQQILQTLFTPGGKSFRKVFLVEYPRPGVWTIAFQTGNSVRDIEQILGNVSLISLYVPTTPNPTSGFLLMVSRDAVIELNMSVEQALKFIISLGVVQPLMNANNIK